MIDWEAVELALVRFAEDAVDQGVQVVLAKLSSAELDAQRWVEVQHGDEMHVAPDEEYVVAADPPAQTANTIRVRGVRDFMAFFRAFSVEQAHPQVAKRQTARIAAATSHRVLREHLRRQGVKVISIENPIEQDFEHEGRLISCSMLAVRMRAAFEFYKPGRTQTTIDAVEFQVEGQNADGSTNFETALETVSRP